jgi:hypothetical protein
MSIEGAAEAVPVAPEGQHHSFKVAARGILSHLLTCPAFGPG